MTKSVAPTKAAPAALDRDAQAALERALDRLPFQAHLSFETLFRRLDALIDASDNPHCRSARPLLDVLRATPDLRGDILSDEVVREHGESIRVLLSFVFPELMQGEVLGRAWAPFAPRAFFATHKYREVFGADDIEVSASSAHGTRDYYRDNLHAAYFLLRSAHHGDPHDRAEFVKCVRDTTTGLDRFFLLDYDFRFVDVSSPGLTILPEAAFNRLLLMDDVEELVRRMPLDDVVFSGFCTMTYVEITELHSLSLLKTELVEKDALESPERFERILTHLRSLLQLPDLEVGLTVRLEALNAQKFCTTRSVLKDFDGCTANIEDTIYGEAIRGKTPLFIPDLAECDCESEIVAHMRRQGIRSLCLLPLLDDDDVIGLLELSTPRPEELNAWTGRKLAGLVPPLTIAIRRQVDEVASRIDRTLKAHCTAIHPSVEWRFEDAAHRYNREMEENGSAHFEDIVFEDVYPLYGAMDIRGSSTSRNQAIQSDLLEQLDLARSTLSCIATRHPMPIVGYHDAALEKFRASVAEGLKSGDEISVIEFLHDRVEPFFGTLRETVRQEDAGGDPDPVGVYFARLDPERGLLHRQRKAYEASVALINDTLAEYLDHEEAKAQAVFPHYFEKYKTDGVEHDIYIGPSMVHGRTFDPVQLQNLRLWQLEVMCSMARLAQSLLPRMDVKLLTTPLVLVQSTPLTIQFSTEEKQFVVEGSYNIRYEIIKKRIDKSTVQGTDERLTQPGRLSVIYTHDRERDEYLHYFEYLAEKGVLEPGVERLDLNDLQGVHGLRALRAAIVLS